MNNEEKILEILAQMQTTLTDVNVRLGLVETRLDKLETTQAKMQDEVHLTNARIDMDIGQRLDALAEGQDVMEERMARMEGTLDEVKKQAEETGDKVDVIHAVVARHSEAISEIKRLS